MLTGALVTGRFLFRRRFALTAVPPAARFLTDGPIPSDITETTDAKSNEKGKSNRKVSRSRKKSPSRRRQKSTERVKPTKSATPPNKKNTKSTINDNKNENARDVIIDTNSRARLAMGTDSNWIPTPTEYEAFITDLLLHRRETIEPVLNVLRQEREQFDKSVKRLEQSVAEFYAVREEIRGLLEASAEAQREALAKALRTMGNSEKETTSEAAPTVLSTAPTPTAAAITVAAAAAVKIATEDTIDDNKKAKTEEEVEKGSEENENEEEEEEEITL